MLNPTFWFETQHHNADPSLPPSTDRINISIYIFLDCVLCVHL